MINMSSELTVRSDLATHLTLLIQALEDDSWDTVDRLYNEFSSLYSSLTHKYTHCYSLIKSVRKFNYSKTNYYSVTDVLNCYLSKAFLRPVTVGRYTRLKAQNYIAASIELTSAFSSGPESLFKLLRHKCTSRDSLEKKFSLDWLPLDACRELH